MEKISGNLFEDKNLETTQDAAVVAGKPTLVTFQTNETSIDGIPDNIEF